MTELSELILGNTVSKPSDFKHVVFLGLHNPTLHMPTLLDWLPNLDLEGTALVIVDNASDDNSLNEIKKLVLSLDNPTYLFRNEFNLGGYGSLLSILGALRNAEWVTTLHQDDVYEPSHVQAHRIVISESDQTLGMISSEAISVDIRGKEIPYPRASWLLEADDGPVKLFLANLRNHTFPFSGASFRCHALHRFAIPWHSTAFPDTEFLMKMIPHYKVASLSSPRVRYLENPESESHHLSQQARDFGAFLALSRVFDYPSFREICDLVPKVEIPQFLDSLDKGISLRIGSTQLRNLLKQIAFEKVAQNMTMSPELATHLSTGYLENGDYRAVKMLRNLGSTVDIIWDSPTTKSSSRRINAARSLKSIILWIFRQMPLNTRRLLFKTALSTSLGRKVLPSWDFKSSDK